MIFRLFRPTPDSTITSLYGAIVAQARHRAFYTAYGVPDTVDGRFDMVVLHLALVLRRLRGEAGTTALAQSLFDQFCRDLDENLREMGVSDTQMSKRMRRFGEAFYGRAEAYDRALSSGDPEALAQAISRNIFGETGATTPCVYCVSAYVRDALSCVQSQSVAAIASGAVAFPDPQTMQAGMTGAEGHG